MFPHRRRRSSRKFRRTSRRRGRSSQSFVLEGTQTILLKSYRTGNRSPSRSLEIDKLCTALPVQMHHLPLRRSRARTRCSSSSPGWRACRRRGFLQVCAHYFYKPSGGPLFDACPARTADVEGGGGPVAQAHVHAAVARAGILCVKIKIKTTL